MKTFGTHIKQVRHEKHLTQVQLAELTGLSQEAISHVETGRRFASRSTAHTLCSVLDIGPPWPARAFLEAYCDKQQRDHGTPPSETLAELVNAIAASPNKPYLVFEPDAVDESRAV